MLRVDPSTWMVEMNECGEAIVSIMVVCRTILKSPNPQYNLSYKSSSSPQASIVSLYIAYLPTLSSSCRPLYPSSLPLSLSLSLDLSQLQPESSFPLCFQFSFHRVWKHHTLQNTIQDFRFHTSSSSSSFFALSSSLVYYNETTRTNHPPKKQQRRQKHKKDPPLQPQSLLVVFPTRNRRNLR
jgi:hypothetical protein